MAKKRVVLDRARYIELHQWFKDNQEAIRTRQLGKTAAARWATEALGFEVTRHNIAGIAGTREGCPIQFEWPREAATSRAADPRLGLIYRMVQDVREQLGLEVEDPELERLWEKLGRDLKVQTAAQAVGAAA